MPNTSNNLHSDAASDDVDILVSDNDSPTSLPPVNLPPPQSISQPEWLVYELSEYLCRNTDHLDGRYCFRIQMDKRLKNQLKEGIRWGCGALILCYHKNTPHVLLYRHKTRLNDFRFPTFSRSRQFGFGINSDLATPDNANLPLKIGQTLPAAPIGGTEGGRDLKDKLKRLTSVFPTAKQEHRTVDVVGPICTWWKTSHWGPYVPYLPPHVSRPAEMLAVYQVTLSPCVLLTAPSFSLCAVAIVELDARVHGVALGSLAGLLAAHRIVPLTSTSGQGLRWGFGPRKSVGGDSQLNKEGLEERPSRRGKVS